MDKEEFERLTDQEKIAVLKGINQRLALKVVTITETMQDSIKPYVAERWDNAVDTTLNKLYLDGKIDADQLAVYEKEIKETNPHRQIVSIEDNEDGEGSEDSE